jgi:hypothetical protein
VVIAVRKNNNVAGCQLGSWSIVELHVSATLGQEMVENQMTGSQGKIWNQSGRSRLA